MGHLVLAMAVFLLGHGIPASPKVRERLASRLGERGYVALHSAFSIVTVLWLAHAYAAAPYVELWPQAAWTRWVPPIAMLFASILLVGGLASPNPLSVGLGGKGYDPARPGILRVTRHPVIWAFILWAGAHIPPNGDVAALILFLPLLLLSLLGPWVLDRKRRRALGEAEWNRLAARTSRPSGLAPGEIGMIRILGGVGLYGLLLWLHPYVIGVWPLPL